MTLEFDARLYGRRAVVAASDAYRDVARVSIEEKDGKIRATIEVADSEIDAKTLSREFANLVLAEMA